MKKKFFKCTQGAISLFLILIMLPFTEIATILISAQRYNASIAVLEEVADSSAVSTLANYDKYVRDRFGLFTVAQKKEVEDTFKSYFDYNIDGVLPGAFSDDLTVTATGTLSLNDNEILLRQIKEYNKLNAPFKMVHDFLDLQEIMKNFEKKFNLTNILNLANAGVDLCNGALDFGEAYEKLVELSDRIAELKSTYQTTYNEFSSAIGTIYSLRESLSSLSSQGSTLQTELGDLNDQKSSLQEDYNAAGSDEERERIQAEMDSLDTDIKNKEDEVEKNTSDTEKEQNKVNEAVNTFNTKKTAYADSHTELISKLDEYKSTLISALDNIKSMIDSTGQVISSSISAVSEADANAAKASNSEIDKSLKAYDDNADGTPGKAKDDTYYELVSKRADNDNIISQYQTTKTYSDSMSKSNSEISRLVTEANQAFDEQAIENVINALKTQKTTVSNLTVNDVKNKQNGSSYYTEINVVLSRDQLDRLYLYFDDMSNDVSLSLSDLWEGIKTFIESVLKIKLVYDPALCANIDTSYFLSEFGIDVDNPSTNTLLSLILSIGSLLGSIATLGVEIVTFDFIEAWETLKQILKDVANIISSIGNLATQLVSNVLGYIQDPSLLLFPFYLTQTLPCRTDYKTGKNMTGNSYSKIEYANYGDGGVSGLPVISDFVSLFSLVTGGKAADDKMFAGAELEYLLAGSSNEIENQAKVFFMLYIVRLLLDIAGWGKAYELQAIAAGPHYPIICLLYIIVEPLLDCVLLVNGSKVALWKNSPYLSTSGMVEFVPKLCSLVSTDDTSKANMRAKAAKIFQNENRKDVITGTGTASYEKGGLMEMTYKEYLMLIMLLFSNPDAELNLLKNLIQLETLAYNTENDKGDFDIRKAYTQVTITAEGSAKPLLATAFSNSIFDFSRTQTRGY